MSRENIKKWDVVRVPSGELGIVIRVVEDFDSPSVWASVQLNPNDNVNPLYNMDDLAFVCHAKDRFVLLSHTSKENYRGDIYVGDTRWVEYSKSYIATTPQGNSENFVFELQAIQWLEDQYR